MAAIPEVKLQVIKELTLEKELSLGRAAFVSAASGLVKRGEDFFIISDDELHLFRFKIDDKFLKSFILSEKELPVKKDKRKKQKPDFESLFFLEKNLWAPHGALIAWPSGSTKNRKTAKIIEFDEKGALLKPQPVDIGELVGKIRELVKDVNMEGIAVVNERIWILQRGSGVRAENGILELEASEWLKGLKSGQWKTKVKYQKLNLHKINDTHLSFTDAISTKWGFFALATAEENKNSYDDGKVHGSILVKIDKETVKPIVHFKPDVKLEGIAMEEGSDGATLYLVDDADDPLKPSRLYKTFLSNELLK